MPDELDIKSIATNETISNEAKEDFVGYRTPRSMRSVAVEAVSIIRNPRNGLPGNYPFESGSYASIA